MMRIIWLPSIPAWRFQVRDSGASGQNTITVDLPYSTAQIDVWTHLAAVRSGTVLSIYANGTMVSASTNAALSAMLDSAEYYTTIGALRNRADPGGGSFFHGNIDELRMHDRALTSDEVKQLYRMGALPRGLK
jgi:hypothetical protein